MMREKLEALDRYNGIEKDPEGVYIMRDEALAILASAPADALRDWAEHTASFLREWRKPPRLDPDDMADYGQQLQGEADELISEYAALREGAKEGT